MVDYYDNIYDTYAWDFDTASYLEEFGCPDDSLDYNLREYYNNSDFKNGIHHYPGKPDSKFIFSSRYIDGKKVEGYELEINENKKELTQQWLKNNSVVFQVISINNFRVRYFLYEVSEQALTLLKKRFYKIFDPSINPLIK